MGVNEPKKILYIASAQPWYTRVHYIQSLLHNHSVTTVLSHHTSYPLRLISVWWQLLCLKNKKSYDYIVIGFTAQALIPLVRLVFSKQYVIADFFISLYDSLCFDRQRCSPSSLLGKLLFFFEQKTIAASDHILVDTQQSKQYFVTTFNQPENKISVLYTLPDTKLFQPKPSTKTQPTVFYYGTGLALHGFETILQASLLVQQKNPDIRFIFAGPTQNYSTLLSELAISNTTFIPWIAYAELPSYISQATICLGGHFSASNKARRVIAGKTFQFAAMKKPIILGDNPANQELFSDQINAVLVQPNNPKALAESIITLLKSAEHMNQLGMAAHKTILTIAQKQLHTLDDLLYSIN